MCITYKLCDMIISELCIDKHKQKNVTKKTAGSYARVPATKTLVMYACGYSHVAKRKHFIIISKFWPCILTQLMCNRKGSNIPGAVSVTGEDTSQLTKACSDSVYVR